MGPCQCCQVRHFLLYCVGTVHPSTLPLGSFGEGTEKASFVVSYLALREALLEQNGYFECDKDIR